MKTGRVYTILLTLMYAIVALFIWWALLDEIVYGAPDILVSPIITTDIEGKPKAVFRVGEAVFAKIEFDRNRNCDGTLFRHIEDGFVYTFPQRSLVGKGSLGRKGPFVNKIISAVDNTRPGNYLYRVKLIFNCNPIGEIVVDRAPAKFEVIK